jgi:hypothetical protein
MEKPLFISGVEPIQGMEDYVPDGYTKESWLEKWLQMAAKAEEEQKAYDEAQKLQYKSLMEESFLNPLVEAFKTIYAQKENPKGKIFIFTNCCINFEKIDYVQMVDDENGTLKEACIYFSGGNKLTVSGVDAVVSLLSALMDYNKSIK